MGEALWVWVRTVHDAQKYAIIMKTKHLLGTALFLAFNALYAADFNAQSLAINERSDPRNAPAIVAMAAVENPRAISRIVTAGVKALPKQTLSIVKAVLRVAPKQAAAVVKAAILAEPRLATEIASEATTLLPDQASAITKAAVAAAPEDLKDSIEGGSTDGGSENLGEANASGGTPPAPSFPNQPVQPDVVSPSS